MPIIPTRDQEANFRAPRAADTRVQPMPKEAFSPEVGQGLAALGQGVADAGAALGAYGLKRQKEKQDKAALRINRIAREQLENMLHDPKKGYLTLELDMAEGATVKFQQASRELHNKLIENEDPTVARLATALFEKTAESMRTRVIQHESRQFLAANKNANEAAVENEVMDADAFQTPEDLISSINRALAINTNYMTNVGHGQESITLENNKVAQRTLESALGKRASEDPEGAQDALDAIAGQVSASVAANVQNVINGKVYENERIQLWNQAAPGAMRRDGTFDLAVLDSAVDGIENYSDVKKEKTKVYLKTKANEAESAIKKQWASDDRAWLNNVSTMKDQDASLDDVLKTVGASARDAVDADKKEAIIRKMYDKQVTDQTAYWNLWTGIRSGEISEKQLVDNEARMSGTDYLALRKLLYQSIENPKGSAAFKQVFDQVEALADDKIGTKGTKKIRRDAFLSEIVREFGAIQGGTPDQLLTLANDKLAKVQVGKWWIFEKTQPAWKVDSEKNQKLSILKGRLENDLGRDVVGKIIKGAAPGIESVDVSVVNEFAAEFGGVDAIMPSTPAGRAIQYLIDHKKKITVDQVRRVLSAFPEWQ